jgi:hypothetical protein
MEMQEWVSFVRGFPLFTTTGHGGAGVGFLTGRVISFKYTTTGHGGDGVGFICEIYKLLRERGDGEVEFLL